MKWVEGPYKDRKGIMRSLCKKTGVRYFRFHALRHLGASQLDASKAALGAIQRILGHENRTTAEIYLHSLCETEREAMALFEPANDGFEKSHTQIQAGVPCRAHQPKGKMYSKEIDVLTSSYSPCSNLHLYLSFA